MNKPEFNARRRFLQQSGALSAAGAAGGSWLLNLAAVGDAAAASNGGNYKALVCVFLYGGNDACNTVLPIDDASWARYDEVRSIPSGVTGALADLRLNRTALLPISAKVSGQTVQYGLHPNLVNLQSLYKLGKVAVVANVGTMTKGPVRRSDLGTTATESNGGLPPKLRSHNDQQTIWQSGRSNQETRGWGGRVEDPAAFAFAAADSADKANAFRSVYLGDSPTFVFGDTVPAYGLTTSNNGVVPLLPGAGGKLYNGVNVSMLTNLLKGTAGGTRSNLLEKDLIQLTARSLDAESYLTAKLSALPLDTPALPADNYLAAQLKIVARVIKTHSDRPGRQVFFVSIGGFDTHDNQRSPGGHDDLLKQVDEALGYFSNALGSDIDKVTTFTASDFGRLLNSNGDGTDHAWGAHHFVMGGAVNGGQVYGRMPSYARLGDSYYDAQMGDDGAMIPVVSVGSYGATMARWFGLTDAEAKGVFPYLYAEGAVTSTNVGFMKGVA